MAAANITLTEQLDNLYTTTWQNMKDTIRDQVFNALPFWYWLLALRCRLDRPLRN